VRIAIMGCIVNGPGEMADADFGYVGGARNTLKVGALCYYEFCRDLGLAKTS